MRFFTRVFVAVLAALPLATAYPPELTRSTKEFCQNVPSPELLALHEKIVNGDQFTMEKIAQGQKIIEDTLTKRETGELIILDTWFHLVYSSNSTEGGWITPERLYDQLDVLNEAFSSSKLAFKLIGTTYSNNASWADQPVKHELAMKTALREGDYRTLNLYFVPGIERDGGILGSGQYPLHDGYIGKEVPKMDGCLVSSFEVTDEGSGNQGHVAVHEVGHWLGLLHTYEGGCDEKGGDYVDDTPAAEKPRYTQECNARDTCPDLPGMDLITNYMDHNKCSDSFTPGQTMRMRQILAMNRVLPAGSYLELGSVIEEPLESGGSSTNSIEISESSGISWESIGWDGSFAEDIPLH